MIIWINSK